MIFLYVKRIYLNCFFKQPLTYSKTIFASHYVLGERTN